MSVRVAVASLVILLATHARADVDPAGRYSQEIPISVPEFHGLTPDIKLRYSSGAGNGFVGVGWSLDVGSQITRVSATHGIARNDATDRYLLDGVELLPCTPYSPSPSCTTATFAFGSSYGFYSTQIESFDRIRYIAGTNFWTVWHRDGTRLTYFTYDGGYTYNLANVMDTHGNEVHYTRYCDSAVTCYPDTITYANATAPGASIRFVREVRPDPITAARGGGMTFVGYRLRSIVVSMDGALLRVHQLGYQQSQATGASIATTLQQFGRDAVNTNDVYSAGATPALPAMTLATASLAAAGTVDNIFTTSQGLTSTAQTAAPYSPRFGDGTNVRYRLGVYQADSTDPLDRPHGQVTGDFDGDGRADWLVWSVPIGGCTQLQFNTVRMTKTGTLPLVTSTVAGLALGGTAQTQCPLGVYVGDIDGDHRDDLVVVSDKRLTPLLSRGDGTFVLGTVITTWTTTYDHCALGDFDGDGRTDVACTGPTSATNSATSLWIARALPGGSWGVTSTSLAGYGVGAAATHLITAADFNADGFADITIAAQAGSTWKLLAGTSDGAGNFAWQTEATAWPAAPATSVLQSADIDGDGKADAVIIQRAANGANQIYEAIAAKGATQRYRLTQTGVASWIANAQLGDYDGDGRVDLMIGTNQTWAHGRGDGQYDAPNAGSPMANCSPAALGDGLVQFTADLNGDGRSDILCGDDSASQAGAGLVTLHDRMSSVVTTDPSHWIQADITGDGIPELLYISHRNPGYRVTIVSTTNQTQTSYDLAGGGDEPDTGRFIAMDVGSANGLPDGKADLVLVDTEAGTLRIWTFLSNGDGTFTTTAPSYPWRDANHNVVGYGASDLQTWRPAQIDGDGRGDLIHPYTMGSTVRIESLRSGGDGSWTIGPPADYVMTGAASPLQGADWFVVDVDGDGRSDLVHAEVNPQTGTSTLRTLLGNGDGTFTLRVAPSPAQFGDRRRLRFADINGDGLADLVHVAYRADVIPSNGIQYGSHVDVQAYLADGTGNWVNSVAQVQRIMAGQQDLSILEDVNLVRFMDINGDGRSDLVHLSSYFDVYGNHRTAIIAATNPGPTGPTLWSSTFTNNIAFADYDHDPWRWQNWTDPYTTDTGLLYVHPTQSQAYVFRPTRDRVTKITNGIGGTTNVTYTALWAARKYLPENTEPIVVSTVETRDEVNAVSETARYVYGDAQYSVPLARMGFGWIQKTDATSVTLTRSSVDDLCGVRPTQVQHLDPRGNLFDYTSFGFVVPTMSGAAPYTCDRYLTDDYECEGTGTCRLARREVLTFDVYGNAVTLTSSADQAPTTITNRPVVVNPIAYLVDLPWYETVTTNNLTLASTYYGYDGNVSGFSPVVGDLNRVNRWDDTASTYRTTFFTYTPSGLLATTTDPRNQVETITYEPRYGLLPLTKCGATCDTYGVDLVLGKVTSVTDANSAMTRTTYDAYGRETATIRPSNTLIGTMYLDFGTLTGTTRQRIRKFVTDGSPRDGVLWTETLFDGLGRTYRTTHEGGATIDSTYSDASGRVQATSLAYAAGSSPAYWATYAYDAVGRKTLTTAPDHTTVRTTYTVGRADGTDQIGHVKTTYLDGHGQVIRIDENGAVVATTKFTYDGAGRLATATDPQSNVTTTAYDTLGRKKSITDPDREEVDFGYYANGLLEHTRDATGQVIHYDYDASGRRTSRVDYDASGASTRNVTWSWDVDWNGVAHGASLGRVVAMRDLQAVVDVTATSDYDTDGHVTSVQRCVDATCARTGFEFDIAGRQRTVIYPDGEHVAYTYDASGGLATVGGYVTHADYELDGPLAHMTYGNGVATTITYDPMRRWVNTLGAATSSGSLFAATLVHEPTGRIHSKAETNPTATVFAYTYDALGHLATVDSNNAGRRESFVFDPLGRMSYSSTTGDLHYDDPLHVHAPTSGDLGFARGYDTNGELITSTDPGRHPLTLAWNPDHTLASVTDSIAGTQSALTYDPDGTRVERTTSLGTSIYLGPYVEIAGGRTLFYYYAGDRLIARRDGATVAYYTQDLSHSTRVVSDATGNALDRYEYTAFGGVYAASEPVPQDREYGDGVHDDDSGYTYMRARYYDPKLAHFTSPDSLVPNALDPQAYHRYAYAEGDPVNFWDPSGHMPMRVELWLSRYDHDSLGWMYARGGELCGSGSLCYEIPIEQLAEATIDGMWAEMMASNSARAANDQALMRFEAASSGVTSGPLAKASDDALADPQPISLTSQFAAGGITSKSSSLLDPSSLPGAPDGGTSSLTSEQLMNTSLTPSSDSVADTSQAFVPSILTEPGRSALSLTGFPATVQSLVTGMQLDAKLVMSLSGRWGLTDPSVMTPYEIVSPKDTVHIGEEDPDRVSNLRTLGGIDAMKTIAPGPPGPKFTIEPALTIKFQWDLP